MSFEQNNSTVVDFKQLPDCLFRIWIRPDWDCSNLKWHPGQFLRMGIIDEHHGKKALRAMTIIGIEDGVIEFFMVSVEGGVTSPRVAELQLGDRCFMEPLVTGNFHTNNIPVHKDFDLWMMGTGTGIAPYLAMLQYSTPVLSSFRNIILVHSVQKEQHLCYQLEISKNPQRYPSFSYVPVVTKSDKEHKQHLFKRIPELLKDNSLSERTQLEITPSSSIVLLCGQPGMIKDATEHLKEHGLTKHRRRAPGNMLSERYF